MFRILAFSKGHFFSILAMAVCFVQPTLVMSSTVYGAGNSSCAEWTEAGESGNGRGRAEEWALGYLSGASNSGSTEMMDPDALIASVDSYCLTNTRHTLFQAVRQMVLPPGIDIVGLGNSEGELFDQATMNEICRNSYPNRTLGSYPVRWATTTDFREYSTAKGWNQDAIGVDESFAIRAENTIITADGRAFDQVTGAITPSGRIAFPGAVIVSSTGAGFRGRKYRAKPLCAWGPPNPELR